MDRHGRPQALREPEQHLRHPGPGEGVVSGLYTAFSRSVELTTDILLDELRATRPLSVTRKETIDALRAWARERAVMAN